MKIISISHKWGLILSEIIGCVLGLKQVGKIVLKYSAITFSCLLEYSDTLNLHK